MGRFLVLGTLGRGGMGVVLEAHDATLDRNVALKLLSSSAARHSEARLLREAQALARLSHPNVVQVYDVGELDGQTFIAMELVRGRTLRAWDKQRRPWRAVVSVYLQAARGLAAAHDKGLVHRDFKPENCIIDEEGRVRVLDFGLARERATPEPPPDEPEQASPSANHVLAGSLTRTGVLVGTVAYMALEQLQGRGADALSDQYAFCVSLYEALHGVSPYEGHDPVSLFTAMRSETRRPVPAGIVVPRRLSRALWRGLSIEPQQRWPSMHALIAELEALSRARRSRTVALTLGMGLVLGAAATFPRSEPEPCPDLPTALAGTWDADVQREVEQAFERYGSVHDPALPARVIERLDAYATAWATMTRDSCQATFVTRRQSEARLEHRTRCLERNRNRLMATIAALVQAEDPRALTQAIVLPFRLPDLAACGEAKLREDAAAPVEQTGDERHRALRRAIDEATTLREAGRMDRAAELAQATLARARALGDSGLLGEALEGLGRVHTEAGAMAEAQPVLEEAIVVASAAQDERTAARAWLSLVFVTTMRREHDEAEHHALAARAAVEHEDDDVLRAWLLNNLGILAAERGSIPRARQQLEQALTLKQQALGADHVDVGIAWLNLGAMLTNSGEHGSAVDALVRARSVFERTVGRAHPLSTYALANECHAEHGLGHTARAIERCNRAVARLSASPSESGWESRARFNLAEALWSAGREDEARAIARRAAEVIEIHDPQSAIPIEQWLNEHPPNPGTIP